MCCPGEDYMAEILKNTGLPHSFGIVQPFHLKDIYLDHTN